MRLVLAAAVLLLAGCASVPPPYICQGTSYQGIPILVCQPHVDAPASE